VTAVKHVRRIRNVFVDRGDADDLVASLEKAGFSARVYRRSVRAECLVLRVYMVVADTPLEEA